MNRAVTVEGDPKTRAVLSRAGFDLSEWTDQQLTSVEYTARALREGEKVFVSQAMSPLVKTLLTPTGSQSA